MEAGAIFGLIVAAALVLFVIVLVAKAIAIIPQAEAVMRVEPRALSELMHYQTDPRAPRDIIARGIDASPGAASGKIVFSATAAQASAAIDRTDDVTDHDRPLVCPVCGGLPDFASVHATPKNGNVKHLHCGTCGLKLGFALLQLLR